MFNGQRTCLTTHLPNAPGYSKQQLPLNHSSDPVPDRRTPHSQENLLRAWLHLENCSGEGLALCPRCCPPQILLPSPPACSTRGVTPGQGSSTEAVLTHCCLTDEPVEATSLYQQLQEHCCLFLQHSPHKQQDFYCPISSSSYYLKNDSLGGGEGCLGNHFCQDHRWDLFRLEHSKPSFFPN